MTKPGLIESSFGCVGTSSFSPIGGHSCREEAALVAASVT